MTIRDGSTATVSWRRPLAALALVCCGLGPLAPASAFDESYRADLIQAVVERWSGQDEAALAPRWETGIRVWLKGLSTADLEEAETVESYGAFLSLLSASDRGGLAGDPDSPLLASGQSYYPLDPCRIVDSRLAIGNFKGPLLPGETLYLHAKDTAQIGLQGGDAAGCGVPPAATALVVNVTSANQGGAGHLRVFPSDAVLPISSLVNFGSSGTIANSTVLPLCTDACQADFAVFASNLTEVIVDVSGYFAD